MRSSPVPFQQRTNTSCYLAIPTHGFKVVLSVFRGTPPAKPLDCKIRLNSFGALACDPWADPAGGEPRFSRAILCLVPGDIIKMSVCFFSQCESLSFSVFFFSSAWANKKPCLRFSKQGGEIRFVLRYLLTPGLSQLASGFCPIGARDSQRLNAQPGLYRL